MPAFAYFSCNPVFYDCPIAGFHWHPASFEIHFNPTTLIDFTPRHRIGIGYSGRRIGYTLDVGYGKRTLNSKWGDEVSPNFGQNYQFKEIRTEVKHYLTSRMEPNAYPYWAAEMFLIHMTDTYVNSSYYKDDLQTFSYDRADVQKNKIGAHGKIGVAVYVFDRVMLDLYGGIGLAVLDVKYSNVIGLKSLGPDDDIEFIDNIKQPGTRLTPHATLGFKVGYVFWKKAAK